MNEDEIKEELESFLSFPKSWSDGELWSDGECIAFTENLAFVLSRMELEQLGDLGALVSQLIARRD